MSGERKRRVAAVDERACVACGCCVKVCPLGAIAVARGIAAQVDMGRCVGCGKCARSAPPASLRSGR